MSPWELFGTLFALVCVYLTVKQHIGCWPTGIANNVLWIVMFERSRLYADMGLQLVYIALGVYGWYEWLHGGANRSRLAVSWTPGRAGAALVAIAAVSMAGLGAFLDRFTDTDVPYWDAVPTVLYLTAQWMLAKKYLENWHVWIAGNTLCIGLYVYKHLYLTSAVQVVFIALSVMGYREWKKELDRPDSSSASSCLPMPDTGS